ncbi:response regulator [Caldalkalibacillus mannanilyticus]|uniref:response regulator n=1 Tax=Caldalkalibacillus mannanilyticus TaxID=1418 RepID=UPI00046AB5C0|nr:response regulator transcription factor [Caldalkalibacillus mannanilyticus]
MEKHTRILVADDHAHAREAVREILKPYPSLDIIAEAKNGLETLLLVEEHQPDLILMDINMPELDGLEATKRIKSRYPAIKIIIMTVSDEAINLFEALKNGAQGYLLKNLHPASWYEYIQAVARDEAPMSKEIAGQILRELSPKQKAAAPTKETPLSFREQEILELVAKGQTNREISEQLHISENTVKNHLKNILQKLHLENRVQLARYAYEHGLF